MASVLSSPTPSTVRTTLLSLFAFIQNTLSGIEPFVWIPTIAILASCLLLSLLRSTSLGLTFGMEHRELAETLLEGAIWTGVGSWVWIGTSVVSHLVWDAYANAKRGPISLPSTNKYKVVDHPEAEESLRTGVSLHLSNLFFRLYQFTTILSTNLTIFSILALLWNPARVLVLVPSIVGTVVAIGLSNMFVMGWWWSDASYTSGQEGMDLEWDPVQEEVIYVEKQGNTVL